MGKATRQGVSTARAAAYHGAPSASVRPLHVLYISQYFPPEMGAPAARVHEVSREWVRLGHRVTVLTGFPNHPTGVIPEAYRGRIRARERKDGIDVLRTWLYAAPNRGRVRRILNYLSFPASALVLGLPRVRDVDVVVATSPQFFVAVAGWVAAAVLRRPFVFEVRDLWPDSIEAVQAMRSRVVLRALRAVEGFLYRRADRIVAVARSTPRILAERGFDAAKMRVIPNGVDLEAFRPGPKENEVRRGLVPPGGFLLSYVGTHGMAHALHVLLETAESLRGDPRFRFVLVGDGAEKPRLQEMARARGLDNVTFVEQQPRERLLDYYHASDACLVPLRKTPLFRAVLPSKMFEIMGAGRPIVLGVEGEAAELLEESQAGLAVPPESVPALRDALLRLAGDPAAAEEMGRRGRRYVETRYSRPVLAAAYGDVLQELA
jgi:colanic acid biosynthesis glycosyl transferase WcaI